MAKKRAPPQESAFLADICARPEDDTPRLVFADWLDDHGQAHRAEFIRLQLRLASLPEAHPEREALEEREWELLAVYRNDWSKGLPGWAKGMAPLFRRGFIDEVGAPLSEFAKEGETLFAVVPVRGLSLLAWAREVGELAASPLLRQVTALHLRWVHLTPTHLRQLLASPHLTGLTTLSLSNTGLSGEGIEALADWPGLARIRRLDLARNELSPVAIEWLLRSRYLTGLEGLELSGNRMIASVLRTLATATPFAGLRYLGLADCSLDADGFEALAGRGALPDLVSLKLGGGRASQPGPGGLGQQSATILGRCAFLARLQVLELVGAGITPETLRQLCWHHPFVSLRRLDLSYNHLGEAGVRELASTPWERLRCLELEMCQLGDQGALALAAARQLGGLTRLGLVSNRIGPEGAAALASSPALGHLRSLSLEGNHIGPAGVRALAASPHLGNLRTLDLANTNLNDEALHALATSAHLGNLRRLATQGHGKVLSREALAELANSPRLPRLLVLDNGPSLNPVNHLRRLGRTPAL